MVIESSHCNVTERTKDEESCVSLNKARDENHDPGSKLDHDMRIFIVSLWSLQLIQLYFELVELLEGVLNKIDEVARFTCLCTSLSINATRCMISTRCATGAGSMKGNIYYDRIKFQRTIISSFSYIQLF